MREPVRVFTDCAPSGEARILATPKSRIFTSGGALGPGDHLHVVRLEIAVDDSLGVRRPERLAHLGADRLDLLGRHGPPGDGLAQRLALQEFHDEVGLAVRGLPEVEDLDDVRVRDHVDRARLVEEP